MIAYQHFTLSNGLNVYVIENPNTPIAVVNLLYNVGSKDEQENKTGFAHLFEHLMFGGSVNIPNFDEPLQKVGGENNAFTSPDITNYYLTVPANNLETAFWLESDRMLGLSFAPEVLEVQRKVVIEEFKQRYLNQPYGDVWLKLRPLAYQKHPYKWATIGKDISHIENATLEDVRSFFYKFYRPNNATLVVAGNVTLNQVKDLSEKWFGPIPSGDKYVRNLTPEPVQQTARHLDVTAEVPLNAIYKVYHMPGKLSGAYYQADLLGDMLGRGNSSRFYQKLIKERPLFNKLNTYITGSVEPGLLVISGMLNNNISHETADQAIQEIIDEFKSEPLHQDELVKVKNQAESTLLFSEVELLNQSMNLAFAANIGVPDLVNQEPDIIQSVTIDEIKLMADSILTPENCSTIYYHSQN
ncbi:MAG: insulinase family protein [Cytophagales bacterium]|nr:insulinase family protein [Cytophagales bacterium]